MSVLSTIAYRHDAKQHVSLEERVWLFSSFFSSLILLSKQREKRQRERENRRGNREKGLLPTVKKQSVTMMSCNRKRRGARTRARDEKKSKRKFESIAA